MKNFDNILDIIYQGQSLSSPLSDFASDSVILETSLTEYLYFGRETPFRSIFLAFLTSVPCQFELQIYNGSTWESTSDLIDDTLSFSRSGFIMLPKSLSLIPSLFNGKTQYWMRIKFLEAKTLSILALNILFSNDSDLKREFFPISGADFKLGASNYFLIHEAVRDYIVQFFRIKGIVKSPWDFAEIEEVRLAAVYLSLSKIFLSVSDNQEDNWAIKGYSYDKKGEALLKTVSLTFIDTEGVETKSNFKVGRCYR